MTLKSIQVKSITAPKDCCKGMMKFPSWQLNAQVDNCKKNNNKQTQKDEKELLVVRAAHTENKLLPETGVS